MEVEVEQIMTNFQLIFLAQGKTDSVGKEGVSEQNNLIRC
jgi:hypothetical protein